MTLGPGQQQGGTAMYDAKKESIIVWLIGTAWIITVAGLAWWLI